MTMWIWCIREGVHGRDITHSKLGFVIDCDDGMQYLWKYLSLSNPDRLAWAPGKVGQFRGNGDPRHGHGSDFGKGFFLIRGTKG